MRRRATVSTNRCLRMPDQNDWSRVPRGVRASLRRFVFDRDGWECRLPDPHDCGGPLELDHIIPRHVAPELLLEPSNMRAACRRGNRGRRPVEFSPSREW